ncbi:MAG TPA: bifunctional UDP-N-acetylglucosamine diphosphorylase/glucosamine-1-phosphate N-acetyltransferase GlmU [Thermoanaerobacterales bacterium]|jgi:bifunctional UDP-N-acetylglucosamine pyrophosphorylase/glucosamine-1-phosphate N-acetyltransferase|nr:bifunctional UDP-N-acetylglucosamine diphosphorylase/glucosamine-1-phosphate N-acetyltransferase GlmU [Thermoanaerobacterales bacterium]
MENFTAVILAAGEGTRMKSNTPKVLHKVCGLPVLTYIIEATRRAGAEKIVVVVGKDAEKIKQFYEKDDIEFVVQKERKGTGHALMQAESAARGSTHLVVLYGDMPLVTAESIQGMAELHREQKAAATVMTAKVSDPTGYGRIIREGNKVLDIREHKDATPEERTINEINAGFYCFDTSLVFSALLKVENNNRQGEYYLTDVIKILNREKKRVVAFELEDPEELHGINDRRQLAQVQNLMQKKIIEDWMEKGVTFINPDTCMVDYRVEIGRDTIIYPGVMLEGSTKIGQGCNIIGPCRIKDTVIGDFSEIIMSQIDECVLDERVKVGPYSNLRPGCKIASRVKVGDFVELKNTQVGEGTKIPHLSYVGDGVLGKDINIGAGVIFVNYDGYKKHQTVVEDNAFVGCNSNLVAPVTVKAGSYIAAGSTITKAVPEDSLAIARARQENKVGWAAKRRNKIEGGTKGDGK